jgi:hypothetical protein
MHLGNPVGYPEWELSCAREGERSACALQDDILTYQWPIRSRRPQVCLERGHACSVREASDPQLLSAQRAGIPGDVPCHHGGLLHCLTGAASPPPAENFCEPENDGSDVRSGCQTLDKLGLGLGVCHRNGGVSLCLCVRLKRLCVGDLVDLLTQP